MPTDEELIAKAPEWARKDVRKALARATPQQRRKVEVAAKRDYRPQPPKGVLGRAWRIGTGMGGALQAPVGLVKDLATAPFTDDEVDGFVNTIYRSTVNRGGQLLTNAMGPEEGIGAALGGLPEGVRQPARNVVNPILQGAETVYREGISEPITAAITAGSLADAPGGGGIGGLFDPENWREGYRIAQDRSPGQALAFAALTKDVTDDAEVARAAGTDRFDVISGTADAILRFRADPTVVVGKLAKAGRTKYVTRPINGAEDINRAMGSGRIERFREAAMNRPAAEIRDQFFPDHQFGASIATALADAGDDAVLFDDTLRSLMGDRDAIEAVRAKRASLAGQIERLTSDRERLAAYGDDTLFADPERTAKVTAELDELYPQDERLARLDRATETLREVPRVSLTGQARVAVTRSAFYQKSPLAAPLRVTFNMTPRHLVNLHDQTGDVQVTRMLRKSELDQATQDALRGEYMAALDPPARQQVLLKAEAAAVRSIAERAGMTVDEIEAALGEAGRQRGRAAAVLQSRVYDGEGRSRIRFEDSEGWHDVHLPLSATQEANFLPLVNLDDVRKAAEPISAFRARFGAVTPIPGELTAMFYKAWRPATLLRGGWPIRVVSDEQLRIIAKLGAVTQVKELGGALKRRIAERGLPAEERGLGAVPQILDYDMQAAFGAPGDAQNIYKAAVSSRASFGALVDQTERATRQQLRESTGEWRSIAPHEPDYGTAWTHAVNNQMGQDALYRKVLAGQSTDDIVAWLRSDPAGRAYAARHKVRARNPQRWVETLTEQVEDYLPSPELRRLALQRKAKADDLVRLLPDASQRPMVHGEITAQIAGKSQVAKMLGDIVEKGYTWLGAKPSDTLSRNRFFDATYRAEATRLVNLADEQVRRSGRRLTDEDLRQIEAKAREYSLGEVKNLLYDLAESSELAEMLRFFSPFFSAFQEVTTRWAGLAVENPAFVARMRLVWRSPEKAGIVTDEKGNRITEDGAVNAMGQRVKAGKDRYLTFALPEWAHKIPGLKAQGAVRFNKESFNMALQGWPGAGPPVQIPVNEIVKDRPDLESSLKFVLPFGTTQETIDLILPATARRIRTLADKDEDRVYGNTRMRLYYDKVVDYNLGKRDTMPTWEEATKEADAFYKMRVAASYFLPAAPAFNSPYQLYIDAYRQRRELDETLDHESPDYQTPDEWFLDTYGEEFFPLTQSLSKSVDGVPPTLEGRAARKKYQDLIEKYADVGLGGLIIGSEGAGEFSRAVYDSQLSSALKPGSERKQRESTNFVEAVSAPEVRHGWIEFGRAMDLIDAERIQRGLPNLQVKGARDLAIIKRAVIEKLAEKRPAWYAEFSTVDMARTEKRIAGMREIASDRRLAGRDDIAGLRVYLQLRDAMSAELAKRAAAGGSKTLTASANQDLAYIWETAWERIVEQNLSFGQLLHRHLERDIPEAT